MRLRHSSGLMTRGVDLSAWQSVSAYDLAIPSALLTSQFRVRFDANMSSTNFVDDYDLDGVPR